MTEAVLPNFLSPCVFSDAITILPKKIQLYPSQRCKKIQFLITLWTNFTSINLILDNFLLFGDYMINYNDLSADY